MEYVTVNLVYPPDSWQFTPSEGYAESHNLATGLKAFGDRGYFIVPGYSKDLIILAKNDVHEEHLPN